MQGMIFSDHVCCTSSDLDEVHRNRKMMLFSKLVGYCMQEWRPFSPLCAACSNDARNYRAYATS